MDSAGTTPIGRQNELHPRQEGVSEQLPLLLDAKAIQRIFGLKTEAGARALMARGRLGRRTKVGDRVYMRRDELLKALERQTEGRRSIEK